MECWKLSNWENYSVQSFFDNLMAFRSCEWVALGVLLVVLLFLLLLARRQPKSIPAFRNDAGKTEITRKALEELIKTSCSQFSAVRKSKSKIKLKGGYLHILIKIKLEGATSLQEVTTALQSQLQEVLVNQMGITKMGKVNVSVVGIKSYGVKAKTTPAPETTIDEPINEVVEEEPENISDLDSDDNKENKF